MKEQVLTITTSASSALLVISTPSFRSVPSMISASTRFLAQPREIKPTRNGFSSTFSFIKNGLAQGVDARAEGAFVPWFDTEASGGAFVPDMDGGGSDGSRS